MKEIPGGLYTWHPLKKKQKHPALKRTERLVSSVLSVLYVLLPFQAQVYIETKSDDRPFMAAVRRRYQMVRSFRCPLDAFINRHAQEVTRQIKQRWAERTRRG